MLAIRLLTGKTSAAPSPVIPRRARVSQSAHAAPTHPHPSSPTPPGRKKATAMRSSLHRCVPAAANFFAFRSSLRSSRYSYFSSIKNNWRITPVKTLRGKPRLVIPAQLGTQRGWRASSKWCKSSQCIYFFPPLSLIQIGGQYLLWWRSLPPTNFLKRISLYFWCRALPAPNREHVESIILTTVWFPPLIHRTNDVNEK